MFERFNGNVVPFADESTSTNRTVFGSETQSDDIDDNLNADFKKGWEIVGLNDNPTREDFNAMGYTLGYLISYLYQNGVAEYNLLQKYKTNSIAIGADGNIYISVSGDEITPNQGNSLSDANYWKVLFGYKLPERDNLSILDSSLELSSTKNNLFDNPRFRINPINWVNNLSGYYKNSVSAGTQSSISGRWSMKSNSSCTVSNIDKINDFFGGLMFDVTYTATEDYLYLRQLIPNVMQLSGKTLTFCIDLEVDSTIGVDLYIQARRDTSDSTRELVIDSDSITINAGRQKIACTFDVPDLYSVPGFIDNLDWKNSLETAFRFIGQSQTTNVKVYDITLVEGDNVMSGSHTTYDEDLSAVNSFYEIGENQITGLSSNSGQKRLYAQINTRKIRTITSSDVKIFDLVGNEGKISVYNTSGTRTDNITPIAISVNDQGISVIESNTSTSAGIAFRYVVNVNY